VPESPELLILGIAQDAGHPHVGCRRPCCLPAWAHPAAGHRVSCLGLIEGDQGWLIDATPDLPAQLNVLEARGAALSGVLLTHGHTGHYTGLSYLGREGLSAAGVAVHAMPKMCRLLTDNAPWEQLLRLGNIALRVAAAGEGIALSASLTATPLLVPHRAEYTETVGYRITGPNRSVLYIPDVDVWWPGIEALIAGVDLALLDGTFFTAHEAPDRDPTEVPHPPIETSLARFSVLPAEVRARIRFIHLNHSNPALNPDSEAASAIRAAGMGVAVEGESLAL
jgi:pyrroloquinoline quinone biosynthesis protein B